MILLFDQELVQHFVCRRRLRTRIVKVSILSTKKLLFDLSGHSKKRPHIISKTSLYNRFLRIDTITLLCKPIRRHCKKLSCGHSQGLFYVTTIK